LAERLPPRRFRLAQNFTAQESNQLCLGFSYGLYRFDRYRSAKGDAASLESPINADMNFVTNAGDSLRMARDWINTPAGDFGPAELAGAARHIAERHRARNGSAMIFWLRIFRRFMRWDAPAAARRG
jgi:leucyl aminopeptidase